MLSTLTIAAALAMTGQVVTRVPAGHGGDVGPVYGYRQVMGHGANGAHAHLHGGGGRITPPGPGYGWGFPNGNPDGYGWVDFGTTLPLHGDRITDYFFRRQFALPVSQMFLPQYYNPYLTRGQRYLPYSNCGGMHPAGGPALGPANLPINPSQDAERSQPRVEAPALSGRVEAPPAPAGGSGLIP